MIVNISSLENNDTCLSHPTLDSKIAYSDGEQDGL